MKNKLKCLLLLLNACVMLSSCQTSNGHSATESINIYSDVEAAIEALLSSEQTLQHSPCAYPVTGNRTSEESQVTQEIENGTYRVTSVEHLHSGDTKYIVSRNYVEAVYNISSEDVTILGIISDSEHIVIPAYIENYGSVKRVDFESVMDIPNAKFLSISHGITSVHFQEMSSKLSGIEILEFPTSTNRISLSSELTMLKDIHVEQGNEYYCSEDGVLYETKAWYSYDTYTKRLAAVPQNYSTDNQILCLADDTDEIATGAIYLCRNLKKVVIPNTVTKIADQAIIATEEHPLTVVCSRDSAAAAYVAEYGNQYYLTVEYWD